LILLIVIVLFYFYQLLMINLVFVNEIFIIQIM
jgi:hypothetical protein